MNEVNVRQNDVRALFVRTLSEKITRTYGCTLHLAIKTAKIKKSDITCQLIANSQRADK